MPGSSVPGSSVPDDDALVDALWSTARRLRGVSSDRLAQRGITPAMMRALSVLLRHGSMRPGQLSEHLHIAPRSATEVVDSLADRGLIERHPDPVDRRATLLLATSEGERMGETFRELRRTETAQLFGSLTPTDRTNLGRILGKLAD